MKKLIAYITAIFLFAASFVVNSDDEQELADRTVVATYLCTAEYSSGYELKNGRWLRERFMPNDKYKVKLYEGNGSSVYAYADDYEYTDCEHNKEEDILQCNVEADFIMNFDTMKFSATTTWSYVHSKRRNRDPVVLTLGTCVKI